MRPAGGEENTASGFESTVCGGDFNVASGFQSTVGGGSGNTASDTDATVPGGAGNTADGAYSFAAGRRADANGFDGAFVFGDSTTTAIQAQNTDEVRSQLPIFAPSFNTTSARAAKTSVRPVDPGSVLDGVESLDISTWEFTDQKSGRHMGPMAEDFHETFDLSDDSETIATVDADGVAFAAIQGLVERQDEASDRIGDLETELAALDTATESHQRRLDTLQAENESLRERLTTLEQQVQNGD